jgi:hypothetical protein
MKDQKTKVRFLIEDQYETKDGQTITEVLAVFSDTYEKSGFLMCYAHLGQHSYAHTDYLKSLNLATEEQYKSLKEELENIVGYNLQIL